MAAPVKKKELVIECVPVPVADRRVPSLVSPSIKEDCFSNINVWFPNDVARLFYLEP